MELFKRLLLALFPEEISRQPHMNPATMFVSFISAKQFFSVITRKIVENYKLNLFDISLDPFEVKVGFGDKPAVTVKNMEFYYGYCATANLNGYRMYSPSNLAGCVAVVSSIYALDCFEKEHEKYYVQFVLAVYSLHFLFAAQLKKFPTSYDKEQCFNRFIELFFNFYLSLLQQSQVTVDKSLFLSIKKSLLKQSDVFFMLFYSLEAVSELFLVSSDDVYEYYNRLFYDEIKKKDYHRIVSDYLSHHQSYAYSSRFSLTELKLLNFVVPADLLLKYLYENDSVFLLVRYFVSNFFDKKKMDAYMLSFLSNDEQFEDFVCYITNYKRFKNHFFDGLQQFFTHYRSSSGTSHFDRELDEFMSAIDRIDPSKNDVNSGIKVPESLKQESILMERLMNFYVTFIGGFWVARGDNFFLRLFRRPMLNELGSLSNKQHHHDSLHYYGGMLYNYSKNAFYYTYAFENIRAGKERFHLPFKSTLKEVYSNMFLLELFDEHFWVTLLQDLNTKDIKIYVQQKSILQLFKKTFGQRISRLVQQEDRHIIDDIYGLLGTVVGEKEKITTSLKNHLQEKDVSSLKDSVYSINFWLFFDLLLLLKEFRGKIQASYPLMPLLGILSSLKETLFGLLLFVCFLKKKLTDKQFERESGLLFRLYLSDIINVHESLFYLLTDILSGLFEQYQDMLVPWIGLDDNEQFLSIGYENWSLFTAGKTSHKGGDDTVGEDIIWFRGYLKNINYYNNRFLVPQDF